MIVKVSSHDDQIEISRDNITCSKSIDVEITPRKWLTRAEEDSRRLLTCLQFELGYAPRLFIRGIQDSVEEPMLHDGIISHVSRAPSTCSTRWSTSVMRWTPIWVAAIYRCGRRS